VLLSLPLFTLSVRSLYLPSAALQVKRELLPSLAKWIYTRETRDNRCSWVLSKGRDYLPTGFIFSAPPTRIAEELG